MLIDDDNNIVINKQAKPEEPPVANKPPVASAEPVTDKPPTVANPFANESSATENPVTDNPPAAGETPDTENQVTKTSNVEVSGIAQHQSEVNTDNGAYSEKTGLKIIANIGNNSYSAGAYIRDLSGFQLEGIYSRKLFNKEITPQDIFSVSAAYRNQANFSTSGVSDQNRVSVEQNYTHKFDNGWQVGAYVNENAKATFSNAGFTPSIGYLAGISFGKGRVSGYIEHQGDWKFCKNPFFSSFVNAGIKLKLWMPK